MSLSLLTFNGGRLITGLGLCVLITGLSFGSPTFPPPVKKPPVPAGATNPIDAFVQAKLVESGLVPSPEADRRTLVRRLHFDVLGLPPKPEEVEKFVSDSNPDAWAKMIDALLASPHYGERWARHWLDVVRFAETHGFEMNQPRPNAWPYRDYVIRSLNSDKPYDLFVKEQLAGDALGADEATAFLVAGPWDQVKSPDPVLTANQRADELADMVNTTGSTFLGLTMGCARCHDHKFDPITQKDYYAMRAVFEGVQHGDRSVLVPDDGGRQKELALQQEKLAQLDGRLGRLEPLAQTGRILLMDEEPDRETPEGPRVLELFRRSGRGNYEAGTGRGQKDDAGAADRAANQSPSYLAWTGLPGKHVFAYEPRQRGRFRLYLSWGCGWNTHATDAAYLLDADGDLATTADQTMLMTVDQQKFADATGDVPNKPLWSGFRDAGVWELTENAKIILRAGKSEAWVSADTLALVESSEQSVSPGTGTLLRSPVQPRRNTDRFQALVARKLRFTILRSSDLEPCIDELEVFTAEPTPRNVALASAGAKSTASGTYPNSDIHRLEHLNDGVYGNSRSWISSEIGKGWVELQFAEPVRIDRVVWGRDRDEKFKDRLATDYKIEVSDGGPWQVVASASDRSPYVRDRAGFPFSLAGLKGAEAEEARKWLAERTKVELRIRELSLVRTVYAGTFQELPPPTHNLNRGDPMQPREEMAPGVVASLKGEFAFQTLSDVGQRRLTDQQRRLRLADWIASPANPLTARVLVNRLWLWHFGEGLVSTPSDFGNGGAKASHPELLDWLAAEFVEHGWSIKYLQRLILNSQTFRQSSAPVPKSLATDAQNRLLWRFSPRRVEAECLRDSILAINGNLNLHVGGPGFSPFEANDNYVRVYNPKKEFGPDDYRRMIYMTKVRSRQEDTFGAFDCPDGSQIAPKRMRSITPLQALNLLNSPFMNEQASGFAKKLRAEAGDAPGTQANLAFQLCFGRPMRDQEQTAAEKLIIEHGLAAFCRALFNANEFVMVY